MTEQTLSLLQHWMKAVVTGGGHLQEKLRAAYERHGLGIREVIAETPNLSAHKRLSIYANGYVLRLLECLREEFPALRSFVGASVFDAFAGAYIITRPSRSPSLFDLGSGFPQFLEETKPKERELDEGLSALLDLPPELARLERARSEVMRAPGTEQDEPATASLSSFAVFSEELMLEATPCLRVLELKFPLVDFLRKSDRGELPEPVAPRATFAAIGRSNYRISLEDVSPWQAAFLKACAQPASVYSAARVAAHESGRETASVLAELIVWLPPALEFGFLRRVPLKP
jgi:hypothetical protein